MLADLVHGFDAVLTVSNIVAIFIGVIFGTALGALPGLTATMGIALVIPLTYTLSPITAFSMLLGAYKGGTYGGSIPAILINTPGTPAAAATFLDGFPMSQKGEAGRAMAMALWASIFGDVFGTLALIFGSVAIAQFALKFGPAEYSSLIIFSLTIVASVSGESLLKGIIMAAFGFLIAMVGLDPMTGTLRFTFGSVYMTSGFNLIVVMIGMFAVSEILMQAANIGSGANISYIPSAKARMSWQDLKTTFTTMVRGSIIGVIIGAIPGLGATPAAYLSYSEAKRVSKNPKNFGKGEIKGLAAVESANNATCSATLIPLLTLGIPGNVTAAVLLGGLMIHGLIPGPSLFREHAEIIYPIFAGLFVSGVVLFIVGTQAIKVFSLITKIPQPILFPITLILCCIGTYGVNSSFFDVGVMGVFGLIGYFLRRHNFPLPPLLIAFILEPIGERAIRQTLSLSDGNLTIFLTRPISLFFLVLAVVGILITKKYNVVEEE